MYFHTSKAIKIAATFVVTVFVAISTLLISTAAAPEASASSKWPTHAKVITNERYFENHHRGSFRITVGAKDAHGKSVGGYAKLYINGKYKRGSATKWGWQTFWVKHHELRNNRGNWVTVRIEPKSSKRAVKTVSRNVYDRTKPKLTDGQKAVKVAKAQRGDPYVYGAAGPGRFDCSGLVQYAYKKGAGENLPHSSKAQKHSGRHVSKPRVGDIVYTPGHVSLYAGNGRVVEAARPGTDVRLVKMWQKRPTYIRP